MTKEEQKLLLKDLCARLPYYTKLWSPTAGDNWAILTPVVVSNLMNADLTMCQVKPYLRPMSSMTQEEMDNLPTYSEMAPLTIKCFVGAFKNFCEQKTKVIAG